MRDYILTNVSMKDILYKYGVKLNKDMFSCPFHGKDKKPSAKAYDNTFHCFACGITGDTIRFVEKYFNLSFKEAMQKINEDFCLGLDSTAKVDYDKINRIKEERQYKEKQKQLLMKKFCNLCDKRIMLERARKFTLNEINLLNIDEILQYETEIRDIQWETENEIENIEKKMAAI